MRRLFSSSLLAIGLVGLTGLARGEGTGQAFLTICADGAAAAMGETQTLASGNALAGIGNPALAPARDRIHVALTRQEWFFDSRIHALAVAWKGGPLGLALDLRTLDNDGFELRSDSNPVAEGQFSQDDYAMGLRASWDLPGGLSVGGALRRVQEKIYNEDSRGWIGDLGLAWEGAPPVEGPLQWSRWRAGATVSHLGSMSRFIEEAPEPPRTLALGLGLDGRVPGLNWANRLQFELRHLQDDGTRFHLGVETVPVAGFAIRAGWMDGYSNKSFTAGLGFVWRDLKLDWSWQPFDGALDEDVHRFTFAFAI